jgi:hypothetical protein
MSYDLSFGEVETEHTRIVYSSGREHTPENKKGTRTRKLGIKDRVDLRLETKSKDQNDVRKRTETVHYE